MCPDGRPMNKYFAPRFSVVLHDYSVSRGKPLSSVRRNYTTPPPRGQAFSFLFARFSSRFSPHFRTVFRTETSKKIQCKSPVKKRKKKRPDRFAAAGNDKLFDHFLRKNAKCKEIHGAGRFFPLTCGRFYSIIQTTETGDFCVAVTFFNHGA